MHFYFISIAATLLATAWAQAAYDSHAGGAPAGHSVEAGPTHTEEAPASVTGCHVHEIAQVCLANDQEWQVTTQLEDLLTAPDRYDGCHFHDGDILHCSNGDLSVELVIAGGHEHPQDSAPTDASPIEVAGCHLHETTQVCVANNTEWEVITALEDSGSAPDHYEGCHPHGETLHCSNGALEVELVAVAADAHSHGEEQSDLADAALGSIDCHEHAGVEHCVDADGNTVGGECSRPLRDYNIPLRIGLLFVILVTSAIGVFSPILISRLSSVRLDSTLFVALRQFGTGVIISTAIIHLFTHAQIYFDSECLPRLEYESTAGAILMAGLFVTFLIELVAHRLSSKGVQGRGAADFMNDTSKSGVSVSNSDDDSLESLHKAEMNLSVSVMEAGIIFHSILIGITLVVASDSSFITLFVVILFHQMFEGIALGSRLAMMHAGIVRKLLMGLAFALITPVGMAIGIGVLSRFNGNDPATIIAIGTLNAFSAGILLWIGLVEMWSNEWWRGPLAGARTLKVAVGLVSLVAGLALMSLLGKWA